MFAPLFTSSGVSATIVGGTYSQDLRAGDYVRWDVSFLQDGNAVTTTNDPDGAPFVDGSVAELWIHEDPNGLFVDENTTESDLSPYFSFTIDGTGYLNMEIFPAFLYPNTVVLSDNTAYNAFHYFVDQNQNFTFFENEQNSTLIQDVTDNTFTATNVREISLENRTVTETFQFDVDTGMMQSFTHYEVFTNGTVIDAAIHRTEWTSDNGGDFIEGVSFSPLLNAGDTWSWDFVTMKDNGVPVTTSNGTGEPFTGSVVTINVVGEPENLNLTDENVDPHDFFQVILDGNTLNITETFNGVGDFAQFIFPVIYDNEGVQVNFFEFAASNSSIFGGDSTTDVTATISGNVFTLGLTESGSDWSSVTLATFDVDTGVMRTLHRTEINSGSDTFEMQLQRQDVDALPTSNTNTNTSSSASNGGLPLPAPGLIWILPALIAVPLIRRKF